MARRIEPTHTTDSDAVIAAAQEHNRPGNIADELDKILHPAEETSSLDEMLGDPKDWAPVEPKSHPESKGREIDAFDLKSGNRIEAELIDNIEHALNFQDGEINRNKLLIELLDGRLEHYEKLAKTVADCIIVAKKKRKQVHASLTAALTAKSMLEAQRTNDED
jgi:hypothetical protein